MQEKIADRIWPRVIVIRILICLGGFGKNALAEPKTPTIDYHTNQYLAQIELLNGPLELLEKQYREALMRDMETVQKAGDLDGFMAYTAEVNRLQKSSRPPHEISKIPSLARLQTVYRENFEVKEVEIKEKRDRVKKVTVARMGEIMTGLTREGKLEEALTIRKTIRELEETGNVAIPPYFRERIPGDRFWEQLEALEKEVDLAGVKKVRPGASGVLVGKLDTGGVAELIGVKVNDRILKVGEQELWSQFRLDWGQEKPERNLVWQSPDGTRHSETIPSGKVGVNVEGDLIPHGIYFEAGKEDARWDDLVLMGILASELDPEVAETALFHAIRQGYHPDAVTSAGGIAMALREDRIAEAQLYADHLLSTAGGEAGGLPPALYPVYFRARLAAGRLDLLYDAEKKTGFVLSGLTEEQWATLLSYWKEVREDWQLEERPSRRLESMVGEDVFSKRRVTEDEKIVSQANQNIHRDPRSNETYTVPVDSFINGYYTVEGGIDNFVWETEIELEASPGETEMGTTSNTRFTVPYRDEEGMVRTAAVMSFIENQFGRKRAVVGGGGEIPFQPTLTMNWGSGPDGKTARFRIIRLGNEVEIQVNGATQCWMPLAGSMQEPGFRIAIIGMSAGFRDGKLLKLP